MSTASGMVNDMRTDASMMMGTGAAASGAGNYFPDNNDHMHKKLSG
jgi:hypothetical protein